MSVDLMSVPVVAARHPASLGTTLHAIWGRVPLAPVALSATLGVIVDRYLNVSVSFALLLATVCLVAWGLAWRGASPGLPLVYLFLAVGALAAAYHHLYRFQPAADDISLLAIEDPRLVRLRGTVLEAPTHTPASDNDPLRSYPRLPTTRVVFGADSILQGADWQAVSGKARLIITGQHWTAAVGERIEVVGHLSLPRGPSNPGEFDFASQLRDQGIGAEIVVRQAADAVTRRGTGVRTLTNPLAHVRAWAGGVLRQSLPPEQSDLASALLLGDMAALPSAEWEKFMRVGVVHVLVISGKHLMVLAGVVGVLLWLLGVTRRRGAVLIALLLLTYALLTGGRPPALRAAVTVCALCGNFLLLRPTVPANTFALAWLVVMLVNPTDIFHTGCQLSFLAVAVLYWGPSRWFQRHPNELEQLLANQRPWWRRAAGSGLRWIGLSYVACLSIWLAVTPLVAAHYHLFSPIGLVLGPPAALLAALALLGGFLLLLAAALGGPVVPLFASLTQYSLTACEYLVNAALRVPGAYYHVAAVPAWWLVGFYVILATLLFMNPSRWRRFAAASALVAWMIVWPLGSAAAPAGREFRCAFLAVGHGGCTVLETPDGRTLLYDAGSLSGPEVARQQIAPFLWSRGLRRIDEIFLSHADLDHFNGLPILLERFAVGQITCTPSFIERPSPGVQHTLQVIHQRGVPLRVARAGDCLMAGDIRMDVLHPPEQGPEGIENVRSLVLFIQHGPHSFLLTGDLEGMGQERLLALPPRRVDVLQAPHHGSRFANVPELADWCRPRLVVASRGLPHSSRRADPYTARGALYLGTWPQGAITIRSSAERLSVETFVTRKNIVLRE